MDFDRFTVIVGNNRSGKSTVLQVLDFLANLVREDFGVVLERRGWKVSDIKSQLQSSQRITIICEIELSVESKIVPVRWEMQIMAFAEKNVFELAREGVWLDNGAALLAYSSLNDTANSNFIQNGIGGKMMILPKFQTNASLLKMMDFSEYPILKALKEFWQSSESFELLSPEKMRLSGRGEVDTIGSSGEKLTAFIQSMNQEQKNRFSEKIKDVLKERVVKIDTKVKEKTDRIQLIAEEKYNQNTLLIESKNMSDGMLRLLAFLAICEIEKKGVFLLDEIENGINLDYAEKIIQILEENCRDKHNQMIVTTHSPIFLDYVDKNNIRYMYREPNTGACRCSRLTDSDELNEKMSYLYPGELFMNMSNSEIIDKLLAGGNA
jgi:predicted ATPase